jgi:hypothetical protein
VNNGLESIRKEVVMASFEVLSQHLPGGREKIKNFKPGRQDPQPKFEPITS